MRKILLNSSLLLLSFLFTLKVNSQVIFTENFEGALDGVTGLPAGWTETGLSLDGIYSVGTDIEANSAGFWPVPAHTLFAMSNDDACGDLPECDKSADRLILPVQDLTSYSGAGRLFFSCLGDDQYGGLYSVQVSTDGGTNWTDIYVITPTSSLYTWQEGLEVNITPYLGMSNVLFSFKLDDQGGWVTGFAIDDVSIEIIPPVVDFGLANLFEYSIIPQSQLVGATPLSVNVTNSGDLASGNYTVQTSIYADPDYVTPIQTFSTNGVNVPIGGNSDLFIANYTFPGLGTYYVEHIVAAAGDINLLNDTTGNSLEISTSEYARDYGNLNGGQLGFGLDVEGTIGQLFQVNATMQLDSVLFIVSPTIAGGAISVKIHSVTAGVPDIAGIIGQSADVAMDQAMVDEVTANGLKILNLPIASNSSTPLILNPGTYFIGVYEDLPSENMLLYFSDGILTPNTCFATIQGVFQDVHGLGFLVTPIIRAFLNTPNQAPIAVDDNATTNQDVPVVISVPANDTDPDGTIVLSSVTITVNPTNGTVSINSATGEITYTPNAGFSGNDQFTYSICDNGSVALCDEATVFITVISTVVDNDGDGVDASLDCNDNDNTVFQNILVFTDSDMDGYDNGSLMMCIGANPPFGFILNSLGIDCNDNDVSINPGAIDIPDNTIDEDCNGSDATSNPVDNDGDGFDSNSDCNDNDNTVFQNILVFTDSDMDGYDNGSMMMCIGVNPPFGFTLNSLGIDCNDNDPSMNPGAFDVPNNQIDEDCNGSDATTGATDNDGDGFDNTIDCNDFDFNINPAAFDIPDNQIDEDCNGSDATTGATDNDGDGFDSNTDCNDSDANVFQNMLVFTDSDMDTYDNGSMMMCIGVDPPFGFILNSLGVDCNDNDPSINPGAFDILDNQIDEDCNGSDATTGATDNDGDGFDSNVDCNDNDAAINPNATDIPDNGIDEDCSGSDATVTNQTPILTNDVANTITNQAVNINVLTNDVDPDGTLIPATLSVNPLPSNGSVTIDFVTGIITYTPNAGFTGTDQFTYFVCDNNVPEACASATVTITIANAEPPIANDDNGGDIFINGTNGFVFLLLNDTDINGNPSTVSGHTVDLDVNTPGIQTQIIQTNPDVTWIYNTTFGNVSCDPGTDVSGLVSLEYQLCDSQGLCDNATITFNVVPNTASLNENSNSVNIYPNPSSDFITVKAESLEIGSYSIISLDGKNISTSTFISEKIDISNLVIGWYVLEINATNGKTLRHTFVKK